MLCPAFSPKLPLTPRPPLPPIPALPASPEFFIPETNSALSTQACRDGLDQVYVHIRCLPFHKVLKQLRTVAVYQER